MPEEKLQEIGSENSYRNILKGTSVFGGVQLFQIAINLVRGKFVAMFLGPVGMGMSSMFRNSTQTIQQLASFGLNLAIVKEIAQKKEDESTLHHLMSVVKHLLLLTGLIGAVVCIFFARPLSELSFGSDEYYWQFVLLSVMVFFGIVGQGYLSILQGLHRVKLISVTTITGAVVGLAVGVPLYAFMGYDGIVPAMIVLAFSMFAASWIGVRKAVPRAKHRLMWDTHKPIVKKLISLGLILMVSDAIGVGCSYILTLLMRIWSGLEAVGLYQAANSLTNQYSGLVFTAMMLDFFPRLSAAASDSRRMSEVVNRQLEIVSLIVAPLICLLVLSAPLVIEILLTEQFMTISPLMKWLGFGVLVKAIMVPLGYISFSKDNRRLFFWLEGIFGNFFTLTLNCVFFYFFGLIGLGYSLIIDCSICFFIYYYINHRAFGYTIDSKSIRQIIVAVALGGACLAASLIENNWLSFSIMGAVTLGAFVHSFLILRVKVRR